MTPVYIINLDANAERMAAVDQQLSAAGIGYTRVDAVNGWELTEAEIAEVYDPRANAKSARAPLVPSEIGCYLSHIRAWKAIMAGDAPIAAVLEDDFRITGDLGGILKALEATSGWDLVKLFTLQPDKAGPKVADLMADVTLTRPRRVPTCTLGYVITRDGARRLYETALPIVRPVDEDHKFLWEHGLRIALVSPAPLTVGNQESTTGTIGTARRQAAKAAKTSKLLKLWRGLRYQFHYRSRLALYWARNS